MLGKLLKYDFLSTGRILFPIYLAMIGMGALFGLSLNKGTLSFLVNGTGSLRFNTFTVVSGVVFASVILMGALVTLVLIIQNFYRNLLGSQGYLMFSLPVKIRTHVTEKGLSGAIWVFLGGLCGLLSLMILLLTGAGPANLITPDKILNIEYSRYLSESGLALYILQLILIAILSAAAMVMKIYASIAIGHLWNGHRAAGAALAYIAFGAIRSALMNITHLNIFHTDNWVEKTLLFTNGAGAAHRILLYIGIIQLGILLLYWAITSAILTKKLNLQ